MALIVGWVPLSPKGECCWFFEKLAVWKVWEFDFKVSVGIVGFEAEVQQRLAAAGFGMLLLWSLKGNSSVSDRLEVVFFSDLEVAEIESKLVLLMFAGTGGIMCWRTGHWESVFVQYEPVGLEAGVDPRTVRAGVLMAGVLRSSSGAGGVGRRRIQEISHWKMRRRTVLALKSAVVEKMMDCLGRENWLFKALVGYEVGDIEFVIDRMAESRTVALQLLVGITWRSSSVHGQDL